MSGAWIGLWAASVVVVALAGFGLGRRRGGQRPDDPEDQAATARYRSQLAEQVVRVTTVGVVVIDRDEFVVLANPAARRLRVVVGDRLALPELVEIVRGLVAAEGTTSRTLVVEPQRSSGSRSTAGRPDGPPLATTLTPVRLPGDDRTSAVVLLVDDISEARRLDAVRRDFVANVSHELKTPVGALTLLAEAVQDAAGEPEAVARFAARMQREGTRLGRLVRELVELSRLQGAEPLPGNELVTVADVVDEAVDAHRLAAEQGGIVVLGRCSADLAVRGNASQLVMAVANLLDNAIAYSPPGTRVAVTVGEDAGRVRIAVSDQGIGIADEDQERVFERFYRVDPARSRATGGTGLGLAIVKHVASNHGGSVSVWSRVGAGSTFTIDLPAAEPSVPAVPAGSTVPAPAAAVTADTKIKENA